MKIPVQTKPALWGALAGAVLVAFIGFNWGGWVTGSKAELAASMRVDAALVQALAPVCVAKFRRDPAVDANLVALLKADSWSQGEFIEKGGWATVANAKPTERTPSVAKACAEMLTEAES